MNKLTKFVVLGIALLCLASPVLAAEGEDTDAVAVRSQRGFPIDPGVAFGTAMIVIGAAYGISKIGSAAVESMARQPEVAGNIQTAMLISAALIEGLTFFGLIVCLIKVLQKYMG